MKISGPEYSPKIKYCELCGEKAGLRCSICKNKKTSTVAKTTKPNTGEIINSFTIFLQNALNSRPKSLVHLWTLMQIFSRLPFKKQIN